MEPTKPSKAPTIQDIARHAGVTKMTVSLTLSGKGRISQATREEVLRIAKELQYEPNRQAQRLSSGQRSFIALFSPSWYPGVIGQKIEAIQGMLNERGYDVPVYGHGLRYAEQANTQIRVARMLRQERPHAIICHNNYLPDEALSELARYQEEGGVLVSFGEHIDLDCDQILFDYFDAGYQAAKHLIDMGHRRIGLFDPDVSIPNAARPRGFCQALSDSGLERREDWIVASPTYEAGGGYAAEKFLKLKDRPTAIGLVNDVSAAAFVNRVFQAGLRVPEDVSVIGQDDVPAARYCLVPLTTVAQPVEEIAGQVVELLCSRLEGRYSGEPRRVEIRGELVSRRSVAPR